MLTKVLAAVRAHWNKALTALIPALVLAFTALPAFAQFDPDNPTVSDLAGESFGVLSDQVPWIFVAIATAVVIGFALKIGPRLLKRMM